MRKRLVISVLVGAALFGAVPTATAGSRADTYYTVHCTDPDGNAVKVRWWRSKDVDTYPGDVSLSSPASLVTSLQVPADAVAGQTIQLVLEATDDGRPTLTRYARVVVSVAR